MKRLTFLATAVAGGSAFAILPWRREPLENPGRFPRIVILHDASPAAAKPGAPFLSERDFDAFIDLLLQQGGELAFGLVNDGDEELLRFAVSPADASGYFNRRRLKNSSHRFRNEIAGRLSRPAATGARPLAALQRTQNLLEGPGRAGTRSYVVMIGGEPLANAAANLSAGAILIAVSGSARGPKGSPTIHVEAIADAVARIHADLAAV